MTAHIGIVISERGAAIVGLERAADGALLVERIERLSADLSAVVERLDALGEDVYVTVDADALGSALWAALGDRGASWSLYTGRGLERQALVDRLLVAIHQDVFRFAAGLAEQEAMSAALVAYHRNVREDGLIGGELVVALLLALVPPPAPIEQARFIPFHAGSMPKVAPTPEEEQQEMDDRIAHFFDDGDDD